MKTLATLVLLILTSSFSAQASDDWKKVDHWRPFGQRWALAYDGDDTLIAIYDLAYPDWSKTSLKLGWIGKAPPLDWQSPTNPESQDAFSKITKFLYETESPEMAREFYLSFKVQPISEGHYDLIWQAPANLVEHFSGPRKICDLQSLKWSFLQTAKVYAIEETLMALTGIGGTTFAGAVAATALDRFFHFYGLMLKTQQNMLLEILLDDTTTVITPDQRKRAIESLVFSQASLETSWKWKWIDPETQWQKLAQTEKANSDINQAWLKSQNINLDPINSRFAWTLGGTSQKAVVVMAERYAGRAGPTVAIDYAQPNKIYKDRLTEEISASAIDFGTQFIPIAGFIVRYIYEKLIETQMDAEKIWEGRLMVKLEQISDPTLSPFDYEISTLQHQGLNPLLATPKDTQTLIGYRRHLIGL